MNEEKGFCEKRIKMWIVVLVALLIATVLWSFHGKGRMARAGRGRGAEGIRISGDQGIRGSGTGHQASGIQTTAPHQYQGPCNGCHTNATSNSVRRDSNVINLKSVNAGNRMTLATAHHPYWGKCSSCHKSVWETCYTCHKDNKFKRLASTESGNHSALMFFGADLLDVSDVIMRELNIIASNGLLVDMVFKGSPAKKNGLSRGDVVLAVDGEVISSLSQLLDMLWNFDEGDKITLSILRKGKVRDIEFQF